MNHSPSLSALLASVLVCKHSIHFLYLVPLVVFVKSLSRQAISV